MRIESLYIDGFGHFHDTQFGPFSAPITVFLGPNEAGKTTLMEFLRAMLFGFPTRGRSQHYAPQHGGDHGGRLELRSALGESLRLVRGDSGRSFSLYKSDGQEMHDDAPFRELLGHASKEMYEAVFAFSLTELQELKSLNEADVSGQIYSAGMGAASLPAALKQLAKWQGEVFKPGGKNQPIWELQRELELVSDKLSQVAAEADRYSDLRRQLDDAKARTTGLAAELEMLATRGRSLETQRQAWDDWDLRRRLIGQLAQLPRLADFPEDALAILEQRQERVRTAQEELSRAESELQQARDRIVPSNGDAGLLRHDETISYLQTSQGRFRALTEELPKLEETVRRRKAEVGEALTGLGAGWSEERIADLALSPSLRDEANDWAANLELLSQAARDMERDAARAAENWEEAGRTVAEYEALLAEQPGSETLESQLEHKRRQLARCRSLREEWIQASSHRDAVIGSEARDGGSPGGKLVPAALGLILGAGFAVVGFVVGGPAAIIGLLAALATFGGSLYWIQRRTGGEQGSSSQLEQAKVAVARAEAMLAEASRQLGVSSVDLESLESVDLDIQALSERVAAQRLSEARLKEARARGGALAMEKEQAVASLAQANSLLQHTRSDWESWLRQLGLDTKLAPADVPVLLAKVEAVRERSRSLADARARLADAQDYMKEYSAPVTRLGAEFAVGVDIQNPASVVTAAAKLVDRYEAESRRTEARRRAEAGVVEAEAALGARREALAGAEGDLSALLARAEAGSVSEFRERALDEERRRLTERRLAECEERLDRLAEEAGGREALASLLSKADAELLERQIANLRNESEIVDARRLESAQAEAAISSDLRRLTSEEESSGLRARREALRAALAEEARRWSVVTLARELIDQARSKYEQERQPAVIQHANSFFGTITGGRYRNLRSPLGTQSLTVEDKSGLEKAPDDLSRGTQEALYLALRFGLIRQFNQQAVNLPVIVDEVLVNFDPERAQRAANGFAELSQTNQILVFTCHPTVRDFFCRAHPETEVIGLEGA